MDITVLNPSFVKTDVVDTIDSIVWIERYNKFGEFEIYTKVNSAVLDVFKENYYITIPGSKKHMIIESLEIKTDIEEGNNLVVRGRSLESLLDRRVVFNQLLVNSANFDAAIAQIIFSGFINVGAYTSRLVTNFAWDVSADTSITSIPLQAQFLGENIYELCSSLCEALSFGLKVELSSDNLFLFGVYNGVDRSYSQSTNPYVVFSPQFDNLRSSAYFRSTEKYKNYSRIVYRDTTDKRVFTSAWFGGSPPDGPAGLDRREMFTDAESMNPFLEGTTTPIPALDYFNQLWEAGKRDLSENPVVDQFEGQADTTINYVYGVDYNLGDIVQIEDEYGHKGRSRITEITISEDLSGHHVYPTFEVI